MSDVSNGNDPTAIHDRATEFFLEQLRMDLRAATIAAVIVAFFAALFDRPWGYVIAASVVAMAFVRQLSAAPLRRGDHFVAVVWTAVGTWGIGIIVVALVPEALPLMIINLLGPLITAAMHLRTAEVGQLTVASMAVTVAMGFLGYVQDGVGLLDGLSKWFFAYFIIPYLIAHVVIVVSTIRASNQIRVDAFDALLATHNSVLEAEQGLLESRKRVLTAGDRERVRIERNIHDGAQQQLISLSVQLQLAAQLAEQGNTVDAAQLRTLHESARDAIEELRDLAQGVYPAILANRGLADALTNIASRSSHSVTVVVPPDLRLGADDEAAIYFVCLEALQNSAKYAGDGASSTIELSTELDRLVVEISDDGAGFDPALVAHSRGLLNMADRVGALGGDFALQSSPGQGTSISAIVPLSESVTRVEAVVT